MGFFSSLFGGSSSSSGSSRRQAVEKMASTTRSLTTKTPAKGSPWSSKPNKGPGSKSGKK